MRGIIGFFLKNSVAANLLMVFIFIMGFFGLMQIKTTFFPEQPSKLITIQVVYPGASPEEMEEGVTTKIEENLVGIKRLKRTTSVSSENAATITIEAERGANMDEMLQDVKNAVDRISSFPAAMEPPVIFKQVQLSDAFRFAISGDISLQQLKKFARQIEDDLLAKKGISTIDIDGFPEEEIEISFREKDMRSLNITFTEAVNAISQTNLLTTGGTIKTESEDLLIRAKNKNYYASEFRDIVIRSNPSGGVIRLHQIANVIDQWEDIPKRNYVNGTPGVNMVVYNTLQEDMFDVSSITRAYLEEFEIKNPAVDVTVIQDGKEYLNQRISFIKENGLLGFLIVLILLAMFLNLRLSFWVALAIPISFAGMFMAASIVGITINVISTFGMIVVIGILVDDGIVIAENIYQHYERGSSPMTAALEGTMEVLPAVTSAILTTVIAFSSFFFIAGFLGDVFTELAIVVIFCLVFSLVEGALILPAHIAHSKALKQGLESRNPITKFFDGVMNILKSKMYGPILKFSMNFPFPTIAFCLGGLLVIAGAFSGGIIKGTFFPFVQSDSFNIGLELPAGTNESQTITITDSIEQAIWLASESLTDEFFDEENQVVEKVVRVMGPETYKSQLQVYLMSGEDRPDLSNRMITSRIRKELGPIYEAKKLNFGLGNIFGDPVSISLLGTNSQEIQWAVAELKSEMSKIKDLADIQDSNVEGLKEIVVDLKPKAHNLGITLGQVMQYVRQGFFGAEIQRLQRGSDEVKVWLRFDAQDRSSLADLGHMRFQTVTGQSIPLSDLATFRTEQSVININHVDGQREIRVTADVSDDKVSVSDINSDINSILIPKILDKYPSVNVGIQGQALEIQEVQESMSTVLPLVFLCMFFVVVITFSSVSQALIVFMIIPFGFIGVGVGHWIMDKPISMLSMLGIIALIGILVNDALVFISTFNDKIKAGISFKTALYDTGISRFRPITLTTITTVAGLMPLLLEKSVQAQFLIPMAISVAFGLMLTTFVLLVLIPALMVVSNRIKRFTTDMWTGEAHTAAMVEPSYPDRKHPWFFTLIMALFVLILIGGLVAVSLKISEIVV